MIESFLDNVVFDKVRPSIGSVVYSDFILSGSLIQHSGIYVGEGQVVHLKGTGRVEKTTIKGFGEEAAGSLAALGMTIYVSCDRTNAVGLEITADYALSEVGKKYEYNISKFNCHQFTSGCVRGWIEPPETMEAPDRVFSTLTGLKLMCRDLIGSNNWRALNE